MTNHTPCLLDEAATFMKVQYLSDLRFLSTDGRSRLAAFLETFDAAEYTLFQWNDAIEYLKCSPTIKNALINAGISYCYIDDFCTGNSNDIKVAAVLREVRQKLDQAFHLNVRDILDEACRATRADMTTAEKNQFYDKYIKTMHVDISPNGEATIVLGK